MYFLLLRAVIHFTSVYLIAETDMQGYGARTSKDRPKLCLMLLCRPTIYLYHEVPVTTHFCWVGSLVCWFVRGVRCNFSKSSSPIFMKFGTYV